jgi:S-(hydroxymethyl)glutathione dehydrogenase/alcohol dehydrogenase
LGCAVTTGFGVINNNAQLKIGQSIAIFGAGGIGLNIVQAAAMTSAWPIIAVDLFDNRLELAESLGATHLINSRKQDVEAEIRGIVGQQGVDVAIDNTGNVKVIETAYRLTSSRGRTVLVGVPPKESAASIYTLPLHFEKTITGSHGGEAVPEHDIPNYVRLSRAGKLRLKPLVGRCYPLTEINQAIEDMRSGVLAGRAIVRIAEE